MASDTQREAGEAQLAAARQGFSERDFYRTEFQGRTLAFALPDAKPDELGPLVQLLDELEANRTRVLVLSTDRAVLEAVSSVLLPAGSDPGWPGPLWRAIRKSARVGLLVPPDEALPTACRRIVLRLRLAKLVWIDSVGPLRGPGGERISQLDVAGLDALLGGSEAASARVGERTRLLEEIRRMVSGGLPAVNLCDLDGVAAELLTFEGAGTFFARERYLEVRRLALDEFDAAHDLLQRGVAEGYLVERTADQLDEVLASAFGVFVEGRYLAGVGALLVHRSRPAAPDSDSPRAADAEAPGEAAGEICSLYTLTRFLGEGVGGHLIDFALERAADEGLEYVFACTTSARVQAFFERHAFRTVPPDQIPAQKWIDYPPERRARVRCLRHG
jgi:N-acetylglutamate synthase-like GNAT family acetyltransferase